MNGVEGLDVADRSELLESALEALTEGIALIGNNGRIALWNSTAEILTGWKAREVAGRQVRQMLDALLPGGARQWIRQAKISGPGNRGNVVGMRHKAGHEIPVVARVLALRDGLGDDIGTEVLFHPAESIDALPNGDWSDDATVSENQRQLQDRLVCMHEEFRRGDFPMGVMWVSVDQAPELQRSHGTGACEAMLQKLEKTIAGGLKPVEEVGRWGDQDLLILCHERTAAALASHAQMLARLARTTDFRWWGDRISLTVSVGAAQAEEQESLSSLLERAQAAMEKRFRAGGNGITAAQGSR